MANINEIEIIRNAQAGDHAALMQLWEMHKNTVIDAHEYGRTGTKCAHSKRSKYAQRFEEASGELYFVFLNAVKTFDPGRGASFKTYLTFKCKMAALDHLRNNTKKITIDGEKVEITTVSIDDPNSGYSYSEEALDEVMSNMYDNDPNTINVDAPSAERKVSKILSAFDANTTKAKVLKAWYRYVSEYNEDPSMEEIGRMVGCTKACVSLIMKQVRTDLAKKGITKYSES